MTQPNTPSSSPDRIFAPRKSKGYDFSMAVTALRTAFEASKFAMLQARWKHAAVQGAELELCSSLALPVCGS